MIKGRKKLITYQRPLNLEKVQISKTNLNASGANCFPMFKRPYVARTVLQTFGY